MSDDSICTDHSNHGYKRILCAIERDKDADVVLSLAGSLGKNGADLHVVSVSDAPQVEEESTYQSFLRGIEERVRFSLGNQQCDVHAEFGSAREKILSVADEIDPDLIILGTHAKAEPAKFMFGSTANHVLHFARCDVLAVRLEARVGVTAAAERYKQVTVAVDMHDTNPIQLLSRGRRLAERCNFSLFNVLRLDECITQERLDGGCLEEAYYRSETQMRELGEKFSIPRERQRIFVGSFNEALVALDKTDSVDLLILGNHRMGERLVIPIDALSAALRSTQSDILVVR